MKRSFFTLLILAFSAVSAMAQGCPTPSTVNASVTFKRKLPGLLDGEFTINSDGDKVSFAQGNLQYNSGTQKWLFASHQYDYIGNTTGNTSITVDGKANNTGIADLFGWVGASSTWTGLKQYGVTSLTSTGSGAVDGFGTNASEALKSDWGNTIASEWRTLSSTEWRYLFNTRSGDKAATVNGVTNRRYAIATINTNGTAVKGIIIFPDGGSFASSEFTAVGSLNTSNAAFTTTTCTTAQWTALETKGCVFLPAAGSRSNTTVSNVGVYGYYWTSSPRTEAAVHAFSIMFPMSTSISTVNNNRGAGCAVRLVQDL